MFFWLVLFLVSASMLIFTAGIWVRLRSQMAQREGKNASSLRRSLADLDDRLKNVRQFAGAALYFFGLLFFIQLTQDIWVTEPGRLSFGITIRGILSLNFAFGANVFFVLAVLHSAQWLVSARILSAQRHLSE